MENETDTLSQDIGQRLRELRTACDITQEELANLVGMSRNYIGEIERGIRNVSTKKLEMILVPFGIGLRTFFDDPLFDDPAKVDLTNKNRQRIAYYLASVEQQKRQN